MHSQISWWIFHENSVSEMLHEKKGVTLWDEFTHHKAVSQKTSFWFLSEDISFVIIVFNAIQNIPSQIPPKQCYQIPPRKERCYSVTWIHKSESNFSECSFWFLSEDIPSVTIGLNPIKNIPSQIPKNSATELIHENNRVTLWNELRHHKIDSQKASF